MNRLTTADVCSILESCATNKVSKLQFGDLIVEFGASKEKGHQTSSALTQEEHDKLNDAQIQLDAQALRDLEVGELALTNPLMLEELIEKGELNASS